MVEVVLSTKSRPRAVSERALRLGKSWRGRIFDIVLSGAGILFLSPVMLLSALAIYLEDGGPILFSQPRLGFGGKVFRCFKFRSMCVDAESRLDALLQTSPTARAQWERDHKLKVDPRITAVGRLLRKSSLDELPQLLNVLKGDMTLVGPRPIIQAEVWRYGRRFRHYCAVKPGLTGLWQVSGRSDATYRSRVAMDVVYSKKRGPLLDIKILAATIPAVISSRGSY
jgi:lipopolysaccharide/colanic/teichoic acid biosynthesis glycosyltransferase